MPYAANVYTVPPGTQATTQTPIDSSDYNAFVADIEAAQNAARPIVAGGTGAVTADLARTALGVGSGDSPEFAGETISSTDASATVGPTLDIYRNSASPAAADAIGEITLSGKDSGGTKTTYAAIRGAISDPTDASEDGQLLFRLMVAGSLATRGLWDASAFVIKDTASRSSQFGAASLQVLDAGTVFRYNATASTAAQFALARARGSAGSPTVVSDGDTLGYLQFEGHDGTNFIRAAAIRATVSGTPGTDDMPGKIEFQTTGDGGTAPGTRVSINEVGFTYISSGSFSRGAPVTKTADFTVAFNENWIISNRAATNTATLPAAATYPGREITLKTIQAQAVVSASSNVVPRAGGSAGTAILPATDGAWATLVSDGTNWEIMQSS